MWRGHVRALRRAGLTAAAIDLPGHGKRRGEPFSVAAACAAVDDAVTRLAPDGSAVVLVGHSLGGYMAGEYASRNPERIALLVLSGCSTTPNGPLAWGFRVGSRIVSRLPAQGRRFDRLAQRLVLRPWARADVTDGGLAYEAMPAALSAACTLRPTATLARLDRPIWLVNGRWDHFRLGEKRLARVLRQGRTVIVPGAGHMAPLDQPVAYTRILLAAVRAAGDQGRPLSAGPEEAPWPPSHWVAARGAAG
jgi:pimeloyl-ACP methyl ester carboxylesterase